MVGEYDIEIGGGHNTKLLKYYYFYLPLAIGSLIVFTAFLGDFILLKFSGIPFLLYAVYGLSQIRIAIKENRNTTIISKGEIRISKNDLVLVLNADSIKDYEIKVLRSGDELHEYHFLIIDTEDVAHLLLGLNDNELFELKNNMDFIKSFVYKMVHG